jgi:hypothetical protein
MTGGGGNKFVAAGLVQFNGDGVNGPGSRVLSGRGSCCVAQPARKTSAQQKTNTTDLNTRQLCGTENETQAVFAFQRENPAPNRIGTRAASGATESDPAVPNTTTDQRGQGELSGAVVVTFAAQPLNPPGKNQSHQAHARRTP